MTIFFYIDYVYNRHEKIMNADLDVSNQNTTYFNFVRKKNVLKILNIFIFYENEKTYFTKKNTHVTVQRVL